MFEKLKNKFKPNAKSVSETVPTSVQIHEKLTDDTVNHLIGHTNVVYYNFETNAWNTNKYNGYTIAGQDRATKRLAEFKSVLSSAPEFGAQYEIAAIVTMTTAGGLFKKRGDKIANPEYNRYSTAVAGNIIVRNTKTGKYELYGKSWVGVGIFYFPFNAVDHGAFKFTHHGVRNPDFRAAVLAAHTR